MFTGVKFFKSPMVKSIIRQQAMTGSEQFAKDLAKFVKAEVNSILARENPKRAGAGAPAEAVVAE
ncbi:hypothetical protein HDU99_005313, partial [Rhizoclosmatium hyalinum]